MAPRGRPRGSSGRGKANPAAAAAKMLDKQIASAEKRAADLDKAAREQRDSIEPLKSAREALGDVGDSSSTSQQAGGSPNATGAKGATGATGAKG